MAHIYERNKRLCICHLQLDCLSRPVRGATLYGFAILFGNHISIHAPRAGRDCKVVQTKCLYILFACAIRQKQRCLHRQAFHLYAPSRHSMALYWCEGLGEIVIAYASRTQIINGSVTSSDSFAPKCSTLSRLLLPKV